MRRTPSATALPRCRRLVGEGEGEAQIRIHSRGRSHLSHDDLTMRQPAGSESARRATRARAARRCSPRRIPGIFQDSPVCRAGPGRRAESNQSYTETGEQPSHSSGLSDAPSVERRAPWVTLQYHQNTNKLSRASSSAGVRRRHHQ
jgi:hypothetical protein